MKNLLPVSLVKMSGAGNTFVLIDARPGSPWDIAEKSLSRSRKDIAKMVCDRIFGVATDGALFIEKGSDGFDFSWDFYNSDGSGAEMCGNAARCAARFCHESMGREDLSNIKFKTGAGLVTAQILGDGRIRVIMPEPHYLNKDLELKTKSSSTEKFAYVNTGVPHLVQRIHNFADTVALKDMAREVRSHEDLQPQGANVTFYVEDSVGKIHAVTFERGVEDYTLACGTGAVAAALVYSEEAKVSDVSVTMPGGLMDVSFLANDPHPLMTGDAVFIGEFQYNLEVLK
ncbi:Diaminopimelate epimerase [compost metagenome]